MKRTLLPLVALVLATGCGGATKTVTAASPAATTAQTQTTRAAPNDELTPAEDLTVAAAQLSSAQRCAVALGALLGKGNPPSHALIQRQERGQAQFLAILRAKPDAISPTSGDSMRDAARRMIRTLDRCYAADPIRHALAKVE